MNPGHTRLYAVKLLIHREAFGLTNGDLARKCGVSLRQLEYLLEGQSIPGADILAGAVAAGFRFTAYDFHTWIPQATVDLLVGKVVVE